MAKAFSVKDIEKSRNTTILMSSQDYIHQSAKIGCDLSKKHKVIYVTMNKTFESLKELFKGYNGNMKNVVIIDAISKTIKPTPDRKENCYFISSPAALTELAIMLNNVMKDHFDYIVIDSVNNFLIYNNNDTIIKCQSSIVSKASEKGVSVVFLAVGIKQHETVINEISMLSDRIVDLSKEG